MCQEKTNPDELLDVVKDRESFINYVLALAQERERARQMEIANPNTYIVDGALDWKNADVSSFLYAALDYFKTYPEAEPSWQMFAEFLYCGKIIE